MANYERAVNHALELADYAGLRARQQADASGRRGDGRGRAAVRDRRRDDDRGQRPGQEFGSVEVSRTGGIVARTGSSSHGQGHETSFAQVVADTLGVPFETIRVLHGDTDETPNGGGTGGSRSLVVGGGALKAASDGVKEKAIQLAAGLLEVSVEDLEYVHGGVEVGRRAGAAVDAWRRSRRPRLADLRHDGNFAARATRCRLARPSRSSASTATRGE